MSGPCAKVVVTATIITKDGKQYTGTNTCNNPQVTCPREKGEGYEKCISVCAQPHHAEVAAITAAFIDGADWRKGHIHITGVHHVCDACENAMRQYEITWTINE